MKKLNETQVTIFKEEVKRASFLREAKKTLNLEVYKKIVAILPEYESMADKNGVSRIELYEGFWSRIKDIGGRLGDRIEMMAADKQGKTEILVQKYGKVVQEIDKLATLGSESNSRELFKGEIDQLPALKIQASQILLDISKLDKNVAIQLQSQSEASAREIQRVMDADSLKYAADKLGLKPEDLFTIDLTLAGSPGAAGNMAGIQGKEGETKKTSKYQQTFNAFSKNYDTDGGTEEKEEKGTGEEQSEPKPEQEKQEKTGTKRQLTVRSVQRPIINLVMRTATAQGVEVNVKQAEDIAIAITKNLVNQMRANGVEFKGVTKDLKESYISELNRILKEERFTRPNQLKNMTTMSKTGTKQTGVKIGSQWIATAKQLKDKIVPFKMHKKEGFAQSLEEASKEENSMIDFLDLANDLAEMLDKDVVRTARSGARRQREIFDNLKDILMATLKQYRKNNIVIVKSLKNNKGDEIIKKISLTPEYRKKYVELKKKVKASDIGDKQRIAGEKARGEDKVNTKDSSMAPATKGKVNISQTVAKAIQAGGLDKDVAKKITPILKNKITKIIARHMDKDVKYLEEKINRYVNSVIKEIK